MTTPIPETAAWMWTTDGELRGLYFDRPAGRLRWYDAVGCHCGEDTQSQSIAAYQQDGAPAFVGPLPEDVAVALAAALSSTA